MKTTDVKEWLHDECVTVLANTNAVTLNSPASHVDHADERDGQTYPFVGIREISSTSRSAGLGNGSVYVADLTYENGIVQSITYKVVPTLRVELLPLAENDRGLQSTLGDDIIDHFLILSRRDEYPADVETVSVEEASPQHRNDEYVYADGIPVEVTYERYRTESVTAAEAVSLDVSVGDTLDVATSAISAEF